MNNAHKESVETGKEVQKENVAVVTQNRYQKNRETTSEKKSFFTQRNICFRCGNLPHNKSGKPCPAKNVTCRNCNKIGHFAKVCQGNNQQRCQQF